MKITVVGSGYVGQTTAMRILEKGQNGWPFPELVLKQ